MIYHKYTKDRQNLQQGIANGKKAGYNESSSPRRFAGVSLPTGEYSMILVVDIGNTTVSFGGIEISDRNEYRVDFTTKLDTNCTWDTADYTVRLLKKLLL